MRQLLLLPAMVLTTFCVCSQESGLQAGDEMPRILLQNFYNTNYSYLDLNHVSNKIVLIDFWNTKCGTCLKQMPKLATLQNKFKDDLLILMVTTEKKDVVEKFFDRRSELKRLGLAFVYESWLLDSLFPHEYFPYAVWIGKDKRIRALTSATDVTEANILALIKRENVTITQKQKVKIVRELPLIKIIPEGNNKIHYSSTLTDSIANSGTQHGILDLPGDKRKILCINSILLRLYSVAYKYEINVSTDPSSRILLKSKNFTGKEMFCYELIFSKKLYADREAFKLMQMEIDKALNIKSEIIKRKTNAYVITLADHNKGKSSGEMEGIGHVGYTDFINLDFERLGTVLAKKLPSNLPLVCEGQPGTKIDVRILDRYKNFDDAKDALREYGINIFIAEREVEFLRLSDCEVK